MDLTEFGHRLADLSGRDSGLRPFVCAGSPLSCLVFIVGTNPATAMHQDFWEFWRPGYGMDKAAWFDSYVRQRADEPLKPGKTRRQTVSSTRRVIEHVVAAAAPVRCLETNVYSVATPTAAELDLAARGTSVLKFLLQAIGPRLLVAHGVEAANAISGVGVTCDVVTVPFSRGFSHDAARELGTSIRARVGAA